MSNPHPTSSTLEMQRSIDLARRDIELRLEALLPPETAGPPRLQEALKHTLLAPGKRFRPLLTLLIARELGHKSKAALDIACSGEMVHTASLILDDLPCMDDAPLRRNRASAHIAFDESTAILTAVALLNRAFGVISRANLPANMRTELISSLSRAVGANGLIAGQLADLSNDDENVALEEVERLNQLKTGALFDFAILAGAIMGKANQTCYKALQDVSYQLGLAFQLLDDIKDQMMSQEEAKKTTGRDTGKATLVALTGCEASLDRLRQYLSTSYHRLRDINLDENSLIVQLIKAQFAFADQAK